MSVAVDGRTTYLPSTGRATTLLCPTTAHDEGSDTNASVQLGDTYSTSNKSNCLFEPEEVGSLDPIVCRVKWVKWRVDGENLTILTGQMGVLSTICYTGEITFWGLQMSAVDVLRTMGEGRG